MRYLINERCPRLTRLGPCGFSPSSWAATHPDRSTNPPRGVVRTDWQAEGCMMLDQRHTIQRIYILGEKSPALRGGLLLFLRFEFEVKFPGRTFPRRVPTCYTARVLRKIAREPERAVSMFITPWQGEGVLYSTKLTGGPLTYKRTPAEIRTSPAGSCCGFLGRTRRLVTVPLCSLEANRR